MFKLDLKTTITRLRSNAVLVGAVLVLVAAVGLAGYFYYRFQDLKQDPARLQASELKDTVEAVGKLIVLPQDEEPTLATVTDPEKLSGQAFFASAKTGFKVLIYTNAKKAILYDPFNDKIVEVAPINIGAEPEAISETTETPSLNRSQVTVKVLNGTGKSGLASEASDILKTQGYSLVSVGDAQAKTQNTVITFSPENRAYAADINAAFNNQAVLSEQAGEQELVLTLGLNFILE